MIAADLSRLAVPYGADQTLFVVEDVDATRNALSCVRMERADLASIMTDMLCGQFNAPVRVLAFNTLEHWIKDISDDVALEIQTLCDINGEDVPEHIGDFVRNHIQCRVRSRAVEPA